MTYRSYIAGAVFVILAGSSFSYSQGSSTHAGQFDFDPDSDSDPAPDYITINY